MKIDLEQVSIIRKKLTKTKSTISGIKGLLTISDTDLIDSLKSIKSIIQECFDPLTRDDIDIQTIEVKMTIHLTLNLGSINNYFLTFSDFIKSNFIKCELKEFYIQDIDYLETSDTHNDHVKNYRKNLTFIAFLRELASYEKINHNILELFFYHSDQDCTLKVSYGVEDLHLINEISSISELTKQFANKSDSVERKQIFINEIINSIKSNDNSYNKLLNNWKSILENNEKSFLLYLSGFSFEKVKSASIGYFHELTDRIHSTISKFSNYIFAIPISYLLLLRFFDFDGKYILKDFFLLLIGVLFFILIWFVILKNIDEAISSISKDIDKFILRIANDPNLDSIKTELINQQKKIMPKQQFKLKIVKIVTIVILSLLLIAFLIIYSPCIYKFITIPDLEVNYMNNDKSLCEKPKNIEFSFIGSIDNFGSGKSSIPEDSLFQNYNKIFTKLDTIITNKRLISLIIIGSTDKVTLTDELFKKFGSNVGLAESRALFIKSQIIQRFKEAITDDKIIIQIEGPNNTGLNVSKTQLSNDRCIKIYVYCYLED